MATLQDRALEWSQSVHRDPFKPRVPRHQSVSASGTPRGAKSSEKFGGSLPGSPMTTKLRPITASPFRSMARSTESKSDRTGFLSTFSNRQQAESEYHNMQARIGKLALDEEKALKNLNAMKRRQEQEARYQDEMQKRKDAEMKAKAQRDKEFRQQQAMVSKWKQEREARRKADIELAKKHAENALHHRLAQSQDIQEELSYHAELENHRQDHVRQRMSRLIQPTVRKERDRVAQCHGEIARQIKEDKSRNEEAAFRQKEELRKKKISIRRQLVDWVPEKMKNELDRVVDTRLKKAELAYRERLEREESLRQQYLEESQRLADVERQMRQRVEQAQSLTATMVST